MLLKESVDWENECLSIDVHCDKKMISLIGDKRKDKVQRVLTRQISNRHIPLVSL